MNRKIVIIFELLHTAEEVRLNLLTTFFYRILHVDAKVLADQQKY